MMTTLIALLVGAVTFLCLLAALTWVAFLWPVVRKRWQPTAPPSPSLADPDAYQTIELPPDVAMMAAAWNSTWAQESVAAAMRQEYLNARRSGLKDADAWAHVRLEFAEGSPSIPVV